MIFLHALTIVWPSSARSPGRRQPVRGRFVPGGPSGMTAGMQGQVIGAGEGALARRTDERLGAAVLAQVTRQLVGSGETLIAPGDRATERAVAVVDALMSLEVRALGVGLETS